MDPAEHSRLLYLVDALRSAPEKSIELLNLAEQRQASDPYRAAVSRLREASSATTTLLAASDDLKRALL